MRPDFSPNLHLKRPHSLKYHVLLKSCNIFPECYWWYIIVKKTTTTGDNLNYSKYDGQSKSEDNIQWKNEYLPYGLPLKIHISTVSWWISLKWKDFSRHIGKTQLKHLLIKINMYIIIMKQHSGFTPIRRMKIWKMIIMLGQKNWQTNKKAINDIKKMVTE